MHWQRQITNLQQALGFPGPELHDEVEESQSSPPQDMLRRLAVKVAAHWEIFPNALILKDVQLLDSERAGSGGFADVYRGMHDGQMVALKKPRTRPPSEDHRNSSRDNVIKNYKVR